MSGGRGDKGLGLLRCREGRAAREFIFAGAGIGLIKDRSEHILTSELLPVRLRAPESIAGRDFDKIGRAECGERVGQDGMISRVAGSLKKKKMTNNERPHVSKQTKLNSHTQKT